MFAVLATLIVVETEAAFAVAVLAAKVSVYPADTLNKHEAAIDLEFKSANAVLKLV